MSATPLVSIVTPAYNQAAFLADAIESVLAQDYPHIEYIVIDDGSTDSTSDVLRRYGTKVRWHRHDNVGQARTLNIGWGMSRGEVLGYLSSDDLLKPAAVSEAVRVLANAPDVAVTYSDYDLIDGSGRQIGVFQTEEFNPQRLSDDLVCQPGPGAFFRKSVVLNCGGWREELSQTPDFDFWLRASVVGRFQRIGKPLASCRVHFQSASMRPVTSARADEMIKVMNLHWQRVGRTSSRSMAMAHVIAAKLHVQSGRYGKGLARLFKAATLSPRTALRSQNLRSLCGGVLRRPIHALKGRR